MLDLSRLSCDGNSLLTTVDALVRTSTLSAFQPSAIALNILRSAAVAFAATPLADDETAAVLISSAEQALYVACPGPTDVQVEPPAALITAATLATVPVATVLSTSRVGLLPTQASSAVCAIASLAQTVATCALRAAARISAVGATASTLEALVDIASVSASALLGPAASPVASPLAPTGVTVPPGNSPLIFGSDPHSPVVPFAAPRAAPQAAPQPLPAPQPQPQTAPQAEPEAAPVSAPQAVPQTPPQAAPQSTPQGAQPPQAAPAAPRASPPVPQPAQGQPLPVPVPVPAPAAVPPTPTPIAARVRAADAAAAAVAAAVSALRQAPVPSPAAGVAERTAAARKIASWDRVRSTLGPVLASAGAFAQGARDAFAAGAQGARSVSASVRFVSADASRGGGSCTGSVWVVTAPSSDALGAVAWLRVEAAGDALGAHALSLAVVGEGCAHAELPHAALYDRIPRAATATPSGRRAFTAAYRGGPQVGPAQSLNAAWGINRTATGGAASRAAVAQIWDNRQRNGGVDKCERIPERATTEAVTSGTAEDSAVWGETGVMCDDLSRGLYVPNGVRALLWTERDASAVRVQAAVNHILHGRLVTGVPSLAPTALATAALSTPVPVAPCATAPQASYFAFGSSCYAGDMTPVNANRPVATWRNVTQCPALLFPDQRLLTARVVGVAAVEALYAQVSPRPAARSAHAVQVAAQGAGSSIGVSTVVIAAGLFDGASVVRIEPLTPDLYFGREHIALIVPLMTVYVFYVLGLVVSCLVDAREDRGELARYSDVMYREAGGTPLDKQGVAVTDLRPYERFQTKIMTAENVRAVSSFGTGLKLYLPWLFKYRHKYFNFFSYVPLTTYSRSRRLAVLMTSIVTCFCTSSLIVHFGIVEAIDIGKTASFTPHSVRVWLTAGFVAALCAAPAYWLPEVVFRRAQRRSALVYTDMAQYYTRVRAFMTVSPVLRQSLQFDEYFDHVDRLRHARSTSGNEHGHGEPRGEALVDLGVGHESHQEPVSQPTVAAPRASGGAAGAGASPTQARSARGASPPPAGSAAPAGSVPRATSANIAFDPSYTSAQMANAHASSVGARRLGYGDPWRWLPRQLAFGNVSAYVGTPLAPTADDFSLEQTFKRRPSGETVVRLPRYVGIVVTLAVVFGFIAYIITWKHQLAFVFTVSLTIIAAGLLFRLRCYSFCHGSAPYGVTVGASKDSARTDADSKKRPSAHGSAGRGGRTPQIIIARDEESSIFGSRSRFTEWFDNAVLQYLLFNGTDGAIAWLGGICMTVVVGQVMAYVYDVPAWYTAIGVVLAFIMFLFSYYVVFLGTASAFFATQLLIVVDSLIIIIIDLLHFVGGIPTFDHLSQDSVFLLVWFTLPVCTLVYADWVYWNRSVIQSQMRSCFGPIAWGVVWVFQASAAFIAINDTIRVPPESVPSIAMGIIIALLVDGIVIDSVRMLVLAVIYTVLSLRMRPRIASEDLLHEFQRYDLDGNGMLDIEEFTDLMLDLGLADDLEEVANLFVRAGGDRTNGQLSFEQLRKAISEQRNRRSMSGVESKQLQSHIGSRRRELYSLFVQLAEDGQRLSFEDLFDGLVRRFESFSRCREEIERIAWQVANYDTPPIHSYAAGYTGRSPVLPPDMTFDNFVAFVHRIQKLSGKTRDTTARRTPMSFAAMVFEPGSSLFRSEGDGTATRSETSRSRLGRQEEFPSDYDDDDDDDEWSNDQTVQAVRTRVHFPPLASTDALPPPQPTKRLAGN